MFVCMYAMSADKYPSIFSRQMEAIVYIFTESKANNRFGIIGPLHYPVTWHGINYTGAQITQWDFQNKGKSFAYIHVCSRTVLIRHLHENLHPLPVYLSSSAVLNNQAKHYEQ